MSRSKTYPAKDSTVFRNTAVRSRKINVKPTMMRGGIRL